MFLIFFLRNPSSYRCRGLLFDQKFLHQLVSERYYIISCFIVCTVDFYVVMTQYSRTSDWFAKNCILPDVCSMLTMSGLIFAKWKSASFGLISMIPWAITMDAVVFMLFFLENRERRCTPWSTGVGLRIANLFWDECCLSMAWFLY